MLGERAVVGDVDPLEPLLAQADRQPAELGRHGQERAEQLQILRRHLRDVDRVRTSSPRSAAATCSATITPARSCASCVEAPRCGVTTTFGRPRMGPDVYGSSGNTSSAAPATCPERSASTSASRSTRSPRAAFTIRTPGLHQRDAVGVDQVPGLGRERSVQGDEVGLQQQVLERCGRDLELAAAIGRHERVEHDDPHPERPRAGGDQLADAAEADDAEHLVGQLHAAEALALPAPLGERGVRLGDVARDREQQAERVLGRGHHVRPGRVGDDDPAPRGSGHVDVVHPGPGPADHLQPAGVLEQVGRDAGRAAHDERVVGADPARERLRQRVQLDVDLELGAQELDSGRRDLLGDEDARHPDAKTSTARAAPAPGRGGR